MKRGRPHVELPEELSAEAHERRRTALGLSKRAYAARIDMSQATYCAKTQHVSRGNGKSPSPQGDSLVAVARLRRDAKAIVVRLRKEIADRQALLEALEAIVSRQPRR